MKIKTWMLAVGLAVCLLTPPAVADQLDDARAAHSRGDYVTALRLYRPVAEQGNEDAQLTLGRMYANGVGTLQDYVEALKWYRMAAEQGNEDAEYHLGDMYHEGKGVPEDYVQAHMWFAVASVGGQPAALMDRDLIAKLMTPDQIAEAQRLAREWLAAHPKQ